MDDTLLRYRAALAKLEAWGVAIASSSRVRLYEQRWGRYLDGTSGPLALPIGESLQLDFDFREIDEIITIVESFDRTPCPEELNRLRLLPKGAEHPDDEQTKKAREAQYELYLRALAVQIDPDTRMSSPDLVMPGLNLAVEAKRPGSVTRVDDRLRAGASRLRESATRGLIALSLDDIGRTKGRWITVPTAADISAFAERRFVAVRASIADIIWKRCAKPEVLGVWLTLRLPMRATDTSLIHVHLHHSVQPTTAVPGEVREMLHLQRLLKSVNT